MTPRELRARLAAFSATETIHPHSSRLFNYSDGVKYLADNAGAYWLLDLIAANFKRARKDRMLRQFQIWRLEKTGSTAVLICLRDADDEAFRIRVPFTDFPLDSVKLYLENELLMLPSER
jgi:hypothetical protein